MLIVFAQLLTVESKTVCRHTRNIRVTKDVETIVIITTSASTACTTALNYQRTHHFRRRRPPPSNTTTQPHKHTPIFGLLSPNIVTPLNNATFKSSMYIHKNKERSPTDRSLLLESATPNGTRSIPKFLDDQSNCKAWSVKIGILFP